MVHAEKLKPAFRVSDEIKNGRQKSAGGGGGV